MNIENKIRKRIKTTEMLKAEHINEIQITREEAAKLGKRRVIDGVKLIVVNKLGDTTKTDCFAYQKTKCYCLKNLYCKNQECKFYKDKKEISIAQIERDVARYSMK